MDKDKEFYEKQLDLAKELFDAAQIHKQMQAERREVFESREMSENMQYKKHHMSVYKQSNQKNKE